MGGENTTRGIKRGFKSTTRTSPQLDFPFVWNWFFFPYFFFNLSWYKNSARGRGREKQAFFES